MKDDKNTRLVECFGQAMKDSGYSWQSLSNGSDKIDRSSLRKKVTGLLEKIQKYTDIIGYEIILKKKK